MIRLLLLVILIISGCSSHIADDPDELRIVILSPELAEIVCALDAEHEIVGITRECDYPKSLSQKTIVGSFSAPNLERIAECDPNLILLSGMEQDMIKHSLEKFSYRVYQYFPNSIDSLYRGILSIGKLLNVPEKADSLVRLMHEQIDSIPHTTYKPTVFVEIYQSPLMTVSNNSLIGDVLQKAGMQNIFPVLPREYCAISSEKIVEKNPEIILITYPGVTSQEVRDRLGWQSIQAVQQHHVYTVQDINPDLILRAGPRIVNGIRQLSNIASHLYE